MQKELTNAGPLLNERGELCEAGYARRLIKAYDRRAIKAAAHRIKEWDYYLIMNGRWGVALTIDDNSYMGLLGFSLLDFSRPWEHTCNIIYPFPGGKTGFPASSAEGDVAVKRKNADFCFKVLPDGTRKLTAWVQNFMNKKPIAAEFTLTEEPEDSMVIVTPFAEDKKAFYYNQKINCMRAEGTVTYGYHNRTYTFDPADSFAVLDWGRGVWTYKNTWYWGSASGLVDGERFGFNIGYGFGNTSAASENMLFYKGRAHKLSQVIFHIPGDGGRATPDYMRPWTFTSDDGRFEMDYTPVLDRASCSDVGLIKSDQHQVFGVFNGRAVLDDGTVLNVKDLPGFAEKVINKW